MIKAEVFLKLGRLNNEIENLLEEEKDEDLYERLARAQELCDYITDELLKSSEQTDLPYTWTTPIKYDFTPVTCAQDPVSTIMKDSSTCSSRTNSSEWVAKNCREENK